MLAVCKGEVFAPKFLPLYFSFLDECFAPPFGMPTMRTEIAAMPPIAIAGKMLYVHCKIFAIRIALLL
jgi:hypothetical protein